MKKHTTEQIIRKLREAEVLASQGKDLDCQRIDEGVMKPEQPGVLYPCPCCACPTLAGRGGYDICYLCDWEDDGQDDPRAHEIWGGPNGAYSLSQAHLTIDKDGGAIDAALRQRFSLDTPDISVLVSLTSGLGELGGPAAGRA